MSDSNLLARGFPWLQHAHWLTRPLCEQLILVQQSANMNLFNSFFNNPTGGRANPIHDALNRLFNEYRDLAPTDSPDEIGMDGAFKLCEDMQVSLEDVGALVLFELVQSPSLGSITREGWVDGWTDTGADSVAKMRNVVLQRRSALPTDPELFKNVYNHTFILNLQERQKALLPEMAGAMWELLFRAPSLVHLVG